MKRAIGTCVETRTERRQNNDVNKLSLHVEQQINAEGINKQTHTNIKNPSMVTTTNGPNSCGSKCTELTIYIANNILKLMLIC